MIRRLFLPPAARLVAGVLLCLAVVVPAGAQQAADTSRAEEQARLQAEKSRQVKPLEGNRAEQAILKIQRMGILGNAPRGLYPWFGSVLGGGWLAAGAGYKSNIGETGSFNMLGGWSLKNYKLLQSNLILPKFGAGRLRASLDAKWIDAPKVSFYGIGNNSNKDNKTSYLYRPARLGGTGGVSITDWFTVGGGYDYLDVQTGSGTDGKSIEEIFTPATVPGLGKRASYGVGRAFAAIDWRTSPAYTRRGGYYRIDWADHAQTNNGPYSFERVDVDLRQFVPLLRENWVLAFRAAATITKTKGSDQMAYFMMPYLGSGETLRGYPNRRFVDRNSLLLQAEYRWTPSRFVDMALFMDTGKVAAHRSDLNFDRLHTDCGIGVRFHGPRFTAFRFDVAKSKEGLSLIFSTEVF